MYAQREKIYLIKANVLIDILLIYSLCGTSLAEKSSLFSKLYLKKYISYTYQNLYSKYSFFFPKREISFFSINKKLYQMPNCREQKRRRNYRYVGRSITQILNLEWKIETRCRIGPNASGNEARAFLLCGPRKSHYYCRRGYTNSREARGVGEWALPVPSASRARPPPNRETPVASPLNIRSVALLHLPSGHSPLSKIG